MLCPVRWVCFFSSPQYIAILNLIFSSGKATRCSQNHAAYKRKNGRLGSATLPDLPNVLVHLANEPIPVTTCFSAAYHNPELFVQTPLRQDTLLSTFADGFLTDSDKDILNACYLRLEQEAEDVRLHRFMQGNASFTLPMKVK
jgi:hypothetical protein